MPSYIERLQVLTMLNNLVNDCIDKDEFYNRAFDTVDAMPSADVAPRSGGEWIAVPETMAMRASYKCSNCNHRIGVQANQPNYCPNCGAKMKKES